MQKSPKNRKNNVYVENLMYDARQPSDAANSDCLAAIARTSAIFAKRKKVSSRIKYYQTTCRTLVCLLLELGSYELSKACIILYIL